MQKLYFITSNANKLAEAKAILGNIEGLDINIAEIQEIDGRKIIEAKLKEAAKKVEGDIFTEDVSLEIRCLNGFPGPLIKWFLSSVGRKKIVDICRCFGDFRAVAKAVIGLMKDGKVYFFEGAMEGEIVPERGENGFGFDPIFRPAGYEKTFAEMKPEEKNAISHRKIALEKMREFLHERK